MPMFGPLVQLGDKVANAVIGDAANESGDPSSTAAGSGEAGDATALAQSKARELELEKKVAQLEAQLKSEDPSVHPTQEAEGA